MENSHTIETMVKKYKYEIFAYFNKAIRHHKFAYKPDIEEIKAEHQFSHKLLSEPFGLSNWISTYVSEKGWQRCLTALRQKRAKQRGRTSRPITISADDYFYLSEYAKKHRLSIAAAAKKAIALLIR